MTKKETNTVNREDIGEKINHRLKTSCPGRLSDMSEITFLEIHDQPVADKEPEVIKDIRKRSSGKHEGMDTPSYSDKINSPTSLHWELYNFIIPKLPQTTSVGRAREIIACLEEELRVEWVAWKILKMKVKK